MKEEKNLSTDIKRSFKLKRINDEYRF